MKDKIIDIYEDIQVIKDLLENENPTSIEEKDLEDLIKSLKEKVYTL